MAGQQRPPAGDTADGASKGTGAVKISIPIVIVTRWGPGHYRRMGKARFFGTTDRDILNKVYRFNVNERRLRPGAFRAGVTLNDVVFVETRPYRLSSWGWIKAVHLRNSWWRRTADGMRGPYYEFRHRTGLWRVFPENQWKRADGIAMAGSRSRFFWQATLRLPRRTWQAVRVWI